MYSTFSRANACKHKPREVDFLTHGLFVKMGEGTAQ